MLTGLLLGLIVVLRCFPETAAARWCDRQVAAVRAWTAKIERRHLLFLALMMLVVVVGGEMLAMAGPLDMGLVLLWDVSTYLDIVLAAGTISAVARGRVGLNLVVARLPRLLPRPRARRTRRAAQPDSAPANDDEGPRALVA